MAGRDIRRAEDKISRPSGISKGQASFRVLEAGKWVHGKV